MEKPENKNIEIDDAVARRLEEDHLRLLESERSSAGDAHDDAQMSSSESLKPALDMLRLIEVVRTEQSKEAAETISPGLTDPDKQAVDFLDQQDFDAALEGLNRSGKIGDFKIIRLLGQGGYGLVFLAEDTRLDRLVALKVPRPELVFTPDHQTRLLREAKAAALLGHPNIVAVYEADRAGSVWYIATEFVDGITLAQWLADRDQTMTTSDAAQLISTLADAVQHAHSRGVLHRDLKPANILLEEKSALKGSGPFCAKHPSGRSGKRGLTPLTPTPFSTPRVADFGLAKIEHEQSSLTRTGSVIGTPAYMSPEQSRGDAQQIGPATDVYSLGAMLYELLTGQPPFADGTILEIMQSVQTREPASIRRLNGQVSRDLESICLKCLEKDPHRRYASAFDLQTDLNRFLSDEPVSARPVTTLNRATKWAKRNPIVASSLLITVASLIAVSILLVRSESSRQTAELERTRANSKATQLTEAIDRLFTAVAESPTIRLEQAAPLRQRLLHEANQMYEQLMAEDPDDEKIRAERARSVFRLARLQWQLGELRRSLELANVAIADAKYLFAANLVDDNELVFWFAFSADRMSDLGDFESASQRFEDAFQLVGIDLDSDEDIQSETEHHELTISIANALATRVRTLLMKGDFAEADRLIERTMKLWEQIPDKVVEKHSSARQGKATCLLRRGTILNEKGRFAAAEVPLEQAVELLRPIVSDPLIELPDASCQLDFCFWQLGIAAASQNQFDDARETYTGALVDVDDLVQQHPRVENYQELQTAVRYSLAVTEMLSRKFVEAEDLIVTNTERLSAMLEQFPDLRPQLLDKLGKNFNILYVIRQQSPEMSIESAEDALDESIRFLELAIDERPNWTKPKLALGRALCNLGNIYLSYEQPKQAREFFVKAEVPLAEIVADNPTWGAASYSLAVTYRGIMNSFMLESQFETALRHCRTALRYYEGRNHQAIVIEAELLAKTGQVDEAYQELVEYIEQTANAPTHFVFAAASSINIFDHLAEKPSSNTEAGAIDSESFRELALNGIRKGLPNDEQKLDEYYAKVRQYDSLAPLLKKLKQEDEND